MRKHIKARNAKGLSRQDNFGIGCGDKLDIWWVEETRWINKEKSVKHYSGLTKSIDIKS